MTDRYNVWKKILQKEKLPAVIVDLEAFYENARTLASLVQSYNPNLSIRIATKSLRVPELIQRILKLGPPFRGLMCYSLEEAFLLGQQGFDDFLVAYPTWQERDFFFLEKLLYEKKDIKVLVDSKEGLEKLAAHFSQSERPVPIVLEVDMSLRLWKGRIHIGVRRSPLHTLDDLLEIFHQSSYLPQIQIRGIMAYEAQVAGLPDRNPFKRYLSPLFYLLRKISARAVKNKRAFLFAELKKREIAFSLFNGGGTGSLSFCAQEKALTEVTAGSGFLCPHLFDYYSNLKLRPAVFFALQVVRFPGQKFATCLGGGYIASGEPGWDRVPQPVLPPGLKLLPMEGCGEVQTPLSLPKGISLELGDPVFFRHAKGGELAEHFQEYLLVRGDLVEEKALTYRGLGWSFF